MTVEIDFLSAELLAQVMTVADAVTEDQQLFCNGSSIICKVGSSCEAVAARHVLHDEVVLLLQLVGHLAVLTGHDISRTTDAVGADDLDGLAAVAGLLSCTGSSSRTSGGSSSGGAACIGSGAACKQTSSSQNSAHGQEFTTFHNGFSFFNLFFFWVSIRCFLRFYGAITSPEATDPK